MTLDFDDSTNIYWARQQVAERLAGIADDLPPGIDGGMAPITTPLGEMFMFTVEGEGFTLAQRRSVLDWTIRPALRTVPGVADVNARSKRTSATTVRDASTTARNPCLCAARAACMSKTICVQS